MDEIVLHKEKYTVEEVSEILLLDPSVIRQAVYNHDLAATRAGKDILYITRSDLLAWLAHRAEET